MASNITKSAVLAWFKLSRVVLLAAGLFIAGVIYLAIMFSREADFQDTQSKVRSTQQLTKILQQEVGDELRSSENLIALIEDELSGQSHGGSLSESLNSHIRLLPDIEQVIIADATGKVLGVGTQQKKQLIQPPNIPQTMAEDALFTGISKAYPTTRLLSTGVTRNNNSDTNNANNIGFKIAARAGSIGQVAVSNPNVQPDAAAIFIFLHFSAQHFDGLLNSVAAIKDSAYLHAVLLHTNGEVIAASSGAPAAGTPNAARRLKDDTWLRQAIAQKFTALTPLSLANAEAPIFEIQNNGLVQAQPPQNDGASARPLVPLSYAQLRDWPLAVAVWAEPTAASSFVGNPIKQLNAAAAALCLIIFLCALAAARALNQREVAQVALRENQLASAQLSHDLAQAQRIGRFGRWHWDLATDIVTLSDDYADFMQVDTGPAPQKMSDWIKKITHPDELPAALDNFQNRLNAEPFARERRVISRSGETRWCYTVGEPILDAAGKLIAYRGITRDITANKVAEVRQQQLSQKLEDAQNIAQMGHFTWLLADDSLDGSANVYRHYEMAAQTTLVTAKQLIERFTEGEHQLSAMAVYRRRFEGKAFRVDQQITTLKKNKKWLETIASPFFDASGALLGYRGIQRDISAAKEAAIAVARSEERYRLISDHMLDIVCLHDADSTVRYVSNSISKLLGYSANASIGVRFHDLIHPDDLATVQTAHQKLQGADAERSQVECRFRALDGSYIWLESLVTKLPENNFSNQNLLFLVVARDATQRKQAEAALRASESRFRSLTQLSADWYWETDASGRFSFFSKPHPVIHNLPLEKILGQYPHIVFPNQIDAQQHAEYANYIAQRQPFRNLSATVRDAQGASIAHSVSNGEPYFDSDGSFAGYRGTGRDVSAEKFALTALKTSSQRFESLTQLSADWYWEQDANYCFTFYSHPIVVGSNVPSNVLFGKTRWEAYPNALTAAQWAQHRARLDARLPFYDLIMTLPARTSSQSELEASLVDCYFALSGSPIFDDHGTFIGYRGTGRDLTIAKRAEKELALHAVELERANRLLDEEATRRAALERNMLISIEMELAQVGLELHDQLGQDLTGISFLIKMLEKRLLTAQSDEAQEAAKIGGLVAQAINHTRMISHGLSPYIWGADGLISAITQLSNDINMLGVAQCHATLETNIVINDDLVARSFYRIAQEAANNALKHGRASQIEISLTQADDIVTLEICDNGIGVAKAIDNAPNSAAAFPNKPGYSYSIQHRASVIGASVTVANNVGGGTVVTVSRVQT